MSVGGFKFNSSYFGIDNGKNYNNFGHVMFARMGVCARNQSS